MPYTIRNARPSVLHIPDAGVRLEAGQTTVVTALTPQMGSLLTARVLEVVTSDVPSSVPVVTPSSLDGLSQDAPAMAIPTEQPSAEALAEVVTVPSPAEVKRGGRKAPALPVTMEPRDDAQ